MAVAAVDTTVSVKGSPVKSLLKFMEAELTHEQKARVFDTIPPEYQRLRSGVFLASDTLPVHILNRLTEEAAKAKGEPLEQFARRAGRAGASDAMSGVYRLFAMVLTPTALLSKAGKIWGSIYSRGRLDVTSESNNSARIALVDFPSEQVGCARVTGWMERMTELTGEKNPRVNQVQCYAKGAKHCEWELSWGR